MSNTENKSRLAGMRFDDGAAFRAADLLVAGEQPDQRPGRAAMPAEGSQDEQVHHQPGLHVRDARPIGAGALDAERTARRLALRKDGIAMAHQQNVALGVPGSGPRLVGLQPRRQAVAEGDARRGFHRQPLARAELAHNGTDCIDAILVVGAAIGVHHALQQSEHRVLLRRQPGGDGGFRGLGVHGLLLRSNRSSSMALKASAAS
jgi:hypothetical protein